MARMTGTRHDKIAIVQRRVIAKTEVNERLALLILVLRKVRQASLDEMLSSTRKVHACALATTDVGQNLRTRTMRAVVEVDHLMMIVESERTRGVTSKTVVEEFDLATINSRRPRPSTVAAAAVKIGILIGSKAKTSVAGTLASKLMPKVEERTVAVREKDDDGAIQDVIAVFLVRIRRIASIEEAADLTAPTMIPGVGPHRVGVGTDPVRTRIVETTENDDDRLPLRRPQHQAATAKTAAEIDRNAVVPLLPRMNRLDSCERECHRDGYTR